MDKESPQVFIMQKKFIFNLFIFHTGISKNEAAQYNEVDNIYRKGFLSKVKFMTGNQDVIETVEKNSKLFLDVLCYICMLSCVKCYLFICLYDCIYLFV